MLTSDILFWTYGIKSVKWSATLTRHLMLPGLCELGSCETHLSSGAFLPWHRELCYCLRVRRDWSWTLRKKKKLGQYLSFFQSAVLLINTSVRTVATYRLTNLLFCPDKSQSMKPVQRKVKNTFLTDWTSEAQDEHLATSVHTLMWNSRFSSME